MTANNLPINPWVELAASEIGTYHNYIAHQLASIRGLADGLSDSDFTRTPTCSEFSISSLITHCGGVAQRWATSIACAPEEVNFTHPSGDEFLTTTTPREQVVNRFDEQVRQALSRIAAANPDTPVPVPSAAWFPRDIAYWTVRWVCLHLIQEFARHAGHGDIIRQTLDGTTQTARWATAITMTQ